MLLAVAVFLEVIPVQQPDVSLPVKIYLYDVARPSIKFILQEIHRDSLPYVISNLDFSADVRNFLAPAESLTIARSPGIAAHVIAALFPVAGLILFQEAHTFDPLG